MIHTHTTLSVTGSSISILTKYTEDNIGEQFCFISEVVGGEIVDTVPFIEGEGGISLLDNMSVSINTSGELVITGTDASSYSLDSETGTLIYTQ